MSEFIIGRLFGWDDFADDGDDVWIIHLSEPAYFMRIVHRPEGLMPSGDLADLYFPLETDSRYAVGNLIFLEPRAAEPREVAQSVAAAIRAVQDPGVHARLALDAVPFRPTSAEVQLDDVPLGFVIGVMYDADNALLDEAPWVVHIGPPPFALRVCDLTNEDLDPEDIWASLGGGNVLGHLHWLSSMACDRDDLRHRAEVAGALFADSAQPLMPDLLPEE